MGRFNKKIPSNQYRKSHCGDKTILRPSYLHSEISYTGKITSLYWIRALSYHLMNFGLLIDWCASTGLIEFSLIYMKIPEINIWWYIICTKCHFQLSRKDRIYFWLIDFRILLQEHTFNLRSPFIKVHVIHEHYYLISSSCRLFGAKPLSKHMLSLCQLDP